MVIILLVIAQLFCGYMLWVVWRMRKIHSSLAWNFINTGLFLLFVEIALGIYMASQSFDHLVGWTGIVFVLIIMTKAISYAIGFTIWQRDLAGLKNLVRKHYTDDESDAMVSKTTAGDVTREINVTQDKSNGRDRAID